MRRFLPRWWPGTCLLAALLTCGCQHSRPCCSTCDANAVALGAPVAANEKPNTTPTLDVPGGAAVTTAAGAMLPPVVQTTTKPANVPAVDPMLNLAPPSRSSVPSTAAATGQQLAPISYREASAAVRPPRRFAATKFAHDANYHWLVGILDYSRIQEAWVLRYVPVEENDRYGGCVTLVMSGRKMDFKHGQTVRVQGALIDPDSQQLRPAFQVEDIRAEQP